MSKEKILASSEYVELKEKFRRFIEQYKEVRKENSVLKMEAERQEVELVLSDSDSAG